MTDDTDTADREPEERAVPLPLIDTYAALRAEIAAKEDRIERLERELEREYLEPAGDADAGGSADETNRSDEAADGAESDEEAETERSDDVPLSHEDWEPETDPLTDTGPVESDGDHEGITAEAATTTAATNDPDPEQTEQRKPETADVDADGAAGADGLKPVRTAGGRNERGGTDDGASEAGTTSDSPTESEFGVTMETSSNLTGGSLGSSADRRTAAVDAGDTAATGGEESSNEGAGRPDPTADRGERLSLLVRRAELRSEEAVVETLVRGIEELDDLTRGMLAHYREAGDAAPVDAHVAAGGSGERQYAYARNRTLRKAGVIEHAGAGRYRYALTDLVDEAFDGTADGQTVADAVAAIESATDID
ncbi:hypothetical protein JCM30237_07050 [Halolamina litorea]|nr:hypothetical protein [Halolamina litorea]